MLTEYQKSIFQTLIHSSDLSDEAAGALLAVYRLYERTEIERQKITRQLDKEEYTSRLAQSDRDNRRRRMDLARAILDETQVHDLDKVAEIIWPTSDPEFQHPLVFDEVSETLDGQPIYCRGSHVQSVPFEPYMHHTEEDVTTLYRQSDMCKHSGCHYLADSAFKNGYCAEHFSEDQPLASTPIDQPTSIPLEPDPRTQS